MTAPSDICGYQPELPDDWESASPLDGVTFTGEYCCYRPTTDGSDRCIWHSMRSRKRVTDPQVTATTDSPTATTSLSTSTTASDFVDDESALSDRSRILSAERIDDAHMPHATIRIDFENLYFYNSRFPHATFTEVQLELTEFTHSLFDNAEFRSCRIGATFNQSSICLAEFKQCEFGGAKLSDAAFIGVRFYSCDFKASTFEEPEFSREVLFSDCSIDHATSFDDIQIQNSGVYEHEARTKLYGQLADLCLSSREINKYTKYKRLERYAEGRTKLHSLKDTDGYSMEYFTSLVNYLSHEYSRVTMGYGYSIGRVLMTMLIVLLVGAFVYTGLECSANALIGTNHTCSTPTNLAYTFLNAFYFSVTTFSTLGYGDISPTGFVRLVAILQSMAGLILSAQFVYVLTTENSM